MFYKLTKQSHDLSSICYDVYKTKKYDKGLKMNNNNNEGLNFNDIFEDDLTEVKECFLEFEKGHTIPSWLKGTLIRNGPAVFGSLQKQKEAKRCQQMALGLQLS